MTLKIDIAFDHNEGRLGTIWCRPAISHEFGCDRTPQCIDAQNASLIADETTKLIGLGVAVKGLADAYGSDMNGLIRDLKELRDSRSSTEEPSAR